MKKSSAFTADVECYKKKVTQNKEAYGVGTSIHVIQTKHKKHIMTKLEEIGGKYSKNQMTAINNERCLFYIRSELQT
jgi:hypothetical protein